MAGALVQPGTDDGYGLNCSAGGAMAHHIETEALTKLYGRQRGVED